jgi:hypothetical protein
MPWFEVICAEDAAGKALSSEKVAARDRIEAAATAMKGLANARAMHGATCYRVVDGSGLVVARSPKDISAT